MKKLAAIPTKYNGVNFRSRLEARWACLFDLLGWDWEYEPIDLPGWIPDFRLPSNVLVEVKPYDNFSDFFHTIYQEIENVADKEIYPNILWLGNNIIKDEFSDLAFLGYCGEYSNTHKNREYELAPILFYPEEGRYGFCQSFISRETSYDFINPRLKEKIKNYPIALEWGISYEKIVPIWREAGNRVQWKKV